MRTSASMSSCLLPSNENHVVIMIPQSMFSLNMLENALWLVCFAGVSAEWFISPLQTDSRRHQRASRCTRFLFCTRENGELFAQVATLAVLATGNHAKKSASLQTNKIQISRSATVAVIKCCVKLVPPPRGHISARQMVNSGINRRLEQPTKRRLSCVTRAPA